MALDPIEIRVLGYFEGKRTDNDRRDEDFSMYILKEEPSRICENEILFEGLIEDTFGLSVVSGKRDKQHMFFSQRYSGNAIELGAYAEPITYSGTLKDTIRRGDKCEGEYHKKDDELNKLGTFSIEIPMITKVKTH